MSNVRGRMCSMRLPYVLKRSSLTTIDGMGREIRGMRT